jgi:hypothetical protein
VERTGDDNGVDMTTRPMAWWSAARGARPARPPFATPARVLLATLAALGPLTACGGTPAPQPGEMRGTPPDLRGRRVVLLPVQQLVGVTGDVDAEIAYALRDRGREVDWIPADSIESILARSPGVDARTRGLPVGQFLFAEVQRVGDPLFGQLRRLAALVSAEAVLIPIAASFEPNQAIAGSTPRVRLTAALIEPRSGRVVWFGVEEGEDFPQTDPRALASAVEALSRTLLWYVGP